MNDSIRRASAPGGAREAPRSAPPAGVGGQTRNNHATEDMAGNQPIREMGAVYARRVRDGRAVVACAQWSFTGSAARRGHPM